MRIESRLTLENMGRLLEQAGSGFEHVVRCGVFARSGSGNSSIGLTLRVENVLDRKYEDVLDFQRLAGRFSLARVSRVPCRLTG